MRSSAAVAMLSEDELHSRVVERLNQADPAEGWASAEDVLSKLEVSIAVGYVWIRTVGGRQAERRAARNCVLGTQSAGGARCGNKHRLAGGSTKHFDVLPLLRA